MKLNKNLVFDTLDLETSGFFHICPERSHDNSSDFHTNVLRTKDFVPKFYFVIIAYKCTSRNQEYIWRFFDVGTLMLV